MARDMDGFQVECVSKPCQNSITREQDGVGRGVVVRDFG